MTELEKEVQGQLERVKKEISITIEALKINTQKPLTDERQFELQTKTIITTGRDLHELWVVYNKLDLILSKAGRR